MINMTIRLPSKRSFVIFAVCIIGVLIISGFVIQGGVACGVYDNISAQLAYIKSHGYEVDETPISQKSFTIADDFDHSMTMYNEIQQSQGFDLNEYKGCTVTRYTYSLKNYPNYTEGMRLSLIVYKGNIIAGDIHSTIDSGFVHGFDIDSTNIDIKKGLTNWT